MAWAALSGGWGTEGDVHLMSFLRILLLAQGLLINGYRLLQATLVSWFCVQLQSAQIFASKGVGWPTPNPNPVEVTSGSLLPT